MKKILLYILTFLSIATVFAQPVVNRSSQANTVVDARWGALYNLFLPRYADTTAANLAKGIDTCGAMIFVYADSGKVYVRKCFPTKYWSTIGGGSSSGVGGFTTANNGLSSPSSSVVQLGYPEATHPLSMDFTGHREISTDSDLVISNKGSAFYVSNPTEIRLHPINGGEIKMNSNTGGGITIDMRSPPVGGAFPGIYYFQGVDFLGQASYHYVGAERHFDIFDMRGTTLSSQIQADGVGQLVVSRDGSACIGCQVDRVDIGGSSVAGVFRGFVDVHRSLYVQDTLILAHTLPSVSTSDSILVKSGNNIKAIAQSLVSGVTSVTGTTNRITSTGGATPVIDISASYVGQSSITTLGTIGTGTWNATTITTAKGGTGADNSTNTSGSFLRSNGSNGNYVASTLILPNAATVNRIPFATATNTWGESAKLTFDDASATMAITSAAASTTAPPNLSFKFTGDANAALSYFNYDHDNMRIMFDAYYNGASAFVSSHSGSNFGFLKNSNLLQITANSGTTAGSTFSWNTNWTMDVSGNINQLRGSTYIGFSGAGGAKLHVLSTTEQLRLGYDGSNYKSETVGSTGIVTYNAVGSGASHVFNNPVNIFTTVGSTSDSVLVKSSGITKAVAQSSIAAGSVPINGLLAATGGNIIDNTDFVQQWSWNTLSSNIGLSLISTSTAASGSIQNLFSVALSGTNASSGQTTYAARITNNHAGATSSNVALYAASTNGTSANYAIIVPATSGNVGIGTSAPTSILHVVSVPTTGIGAAFSSSTSTSGTILDITGTSTVLAANNEALNISVSGANGTNAITATGARISVTNTNGTSGTNVALDLTASGATTNNIALLLREPAASGTNFTGFATQAQAADITYTLPAAVGGAGTVLTDAAGNGTLSWVAGGSGTVTATGGSLTSNAVVLGAGTTDTKVVAGITTDGTSQLNLGVNTTTLGKVKMFGNTSGDATIQPTAAAGTATIVTLPNASSTLPIFGQQITFAGPTAARTITLPDASFTVARTDAANTFTGTQTFNGQVQANSGFFTNTTSTNANIYIGSGITIGSTASNSEYLFAGASNVLFRVGMRGSTSSAVNAGYSAASFVIGTQGMTEAATSTHALLAQMVIKPLLITDAAGATTDATTLYLEGPPTGITPTNPATTLWVAGGISKFDGALNFNPTNTTAGTTGNQTINKVSGTVNIAAAGTTVTVTNSLVTTSSLVFCEIRTNDATATIKNVVPGSGSFVITLNAAATAEISIGFFVLN